MVIFLPIHEPYNLIRENESKNLWPSNQLLLGEHYQPNQWQHSFTNVTIIKYLSQGTFCYIRNHVVYAINYFHWSFVIDICVASIVIYFSHWFYLLIAQYLWCLEVYNIQIVKLIIYILNVAVVLLKRASHKHMLYHISCEVQIHDLLPIQISC